jgi:hypothetical protein
MHSGDRCMSIKTFLAIHLSVSAELRQEQDDKKKGAMRYLQRLCWLEMKGVSVQCVSEMCGAGGRGGEVEDKNN